MQEVNPDARTEAREDIQKPKHIYSFKHTKHEGSAYMQGHDTTTIRQRPRKEP